MSVGLSAQKLKNKMIDEPMRRNMIVMKRRVSYSVGFHPIVEYSLKYWSQLVLARIELTTTSDNQNNNNGPEVIDPFLKEKL